MFLGNLGKFRICLNYFKKVDRDFGKDASRNIRNPFFLLTCLDSNYYQFNHQCMSNACPNKLLHEIYFHEILTIEFRPSGKIDGSVLTA